MNRQFPQVEVHIGSMEPLGIEEMLFRFPTCSNFWGPWGELERGEEGRTLPPP